MRLRDVAAEKGRNGAESPAPGWLERLRIHVCQRRPARLVDRALAPLVEPTASILVSGFMRSGTTWLQESLAEALGAKTVFEPLDPRLDGVRPGENGDDGSRAFADGGVRALRLPFCDPERPLPSPFRAHLLRALRGALPDDRTRRLRRGLVEAARRRVVAKTVRGALWIGAARRALGLTVVHVRRDPRAVAASVRDVGWGSGRFWDLSLARHFLAPGDGRASWFGRFGDPIGRYDADGSPVARFAAYWALSEWFVERTRPEEDPGFVTVTYEELADRRSDALSRLPGGRRRAGTAPEGALLRRDSDTTLPARRGVPATLRARDWRQRLSKRERREVESAVREFGMEHRLESDA